MQSMSPCDLCASGPDVGVDNDEGAPLLGASKEPSQQFVDSWSMSSPRLTPLDIVQFCFPVFVAFETQRNVELHIMRITHGPGNNRVSFSYKTEDGSAIAGVQFEHVSGVVEMEPGQTEAIITVPIKETKAWNATLEFKVALSDPIGCKMGARLSNTRVKVIDTTPFPDDSFADVVSSGYEAMNSINELRVFPAFVKYLVSQPGIPWRTMVMIFIDLLKNVYHYFMMVSTVYMVDSIFNFDFPVSNLVIPGSRLGSSYVVAFVTLAPMLVFFVLDHMAVKLDIKGLTRISMTRSLFRKFMHYNRSSADQIPLTDMVSSLTQDVSDVTFSYMKLIEMIRLLTEVGVSLAFTLQTNPGVWWAAVAVPVIMLGWGVCRTHAFLTASEGTNDAESACAFYITDILTKLRLAAAYMQRPQMNEMFVEKAEQLRSARTYERAVTLTNMFVPKLMGPALVALFTAVGAPRVLNKELELGVFLATIKVFHSICCAFYDAFGLAMEVLGTLPALKGMFVLLNMPEDVADIGRSNDARIRVTAARRAMLADDNFIPKVDRLQIELVNLDFSHTVGGRLQFQNVNFTCEQGKLCSVIAPAGAGRQTLLQLLAHIKFPTSGVLFIPSHLRVVHVSDEVVLMSLSVWENLNFGTHGTKMSSGPDRVLNILRHFKMKKVERLCKHEIDALMGITKDTEQEEISEDSAKVYDAMHEGERGQIHIARAFIMNPEVLVMHRPFTHIRQGIDWDELETAMVNHRNDRGLCMPLETASHRRPRTIFYTIDHEQQGSIADVFWYLPERVGGECKQTGKTSCEEDSQQLNMQKNAYGSCEEDTQQLNMEKNGFDIKNSTPSFDPPSEEDQMKAYDEIRRQLGSKKKQWNMARESGVWQPGTPKGIVDKVQDIKNDILDTAHRSGRFDLELKDKLSRTDTRIRSKEGVAKVDETKRTDLEARIRDGARVQALPGSARGGCYNGGDFGTVSTPRGPYTEQDPQSHVQISWDRSGVTTSISDEDFFSFFQIVDEYFDGLYDQVHGATVQASAARFQEANVRNVPQSIPTASGVQRWDI